MRLPRSYVVGTDKEAIDYARQIRGHSVAEMSRTLGVNVRTIERWREGSRRPTGLARRALLTYVYDAMRIAERMKEQTDA